MTRLLSALVLTTLLNLPAAEAKIWRVNNSTGVTADFTTLQAAHNGAAPGDTIHLEPSLNSYGNLSMTKRLVILGTGAFSTANPDLQADPKHAFVGNISINNTGANGSVISVRFADGINIGTGVANITLTGCVGDAAGSFDNVNCCGRPHIEINNADNIVISRSMVTSIRFTNNSNNIVISNNIIWGLVASDASSDGVITNNVIRAGNANDAAAINNSVVANNIFNRSLNTSFVNCNVGNNFAPGTGTPPSGFTFADMSTIFLNANAGFVDNAFQLRPGSPALGAGEGGIDCGAFGGGNPYRLGATPAIPSIYRLTVPAAPAGNSMTITFSTRSNN
ncbi:MAG: hypothetical protein MUF62_01835 [Chitinophagaceae bacterium]|nr:hypothetical protein [Chitinophagaceae bacterium]